MRIEKLAAVVMLAFGVVTMAHDKKDEKPTTPEGKKEAPKGEAIPPGMTAEQQAEMEAWMKAATPGPEHKVLDYMIGTWDVTMKHWVAPDAPPMESKGTSTAEWILGGRYTRYMFNGDIMGPFEGRGITGYDNIEKKYVAIWIDTMGTGVRHQLGTYDAATKTFTFHDEYKSPMGKMIKVRSTIQIIDNDKHVMTFYDTEAGKPERKGMEITYTRKK